MIWAKPPKLAICFEASVKWKYRFYIEGGLFKWSKAEDRYSVKGI